MSVMPTAEVQQRTYDRESWETGVHDGVAVVARILEEKGHQQLADNFRLMVISWQEKKQQQ